MKKNAFVLGFSLEIFKRLSRIYREYIYFMENLGLSYKLVDITFKLVKHPTTSTASCLKYFGNLVIM